MIVKYIIKKGKEKGSFTKWACGGMVIGFFMMTIFLSYAQRIDATNAQDSLYFANTSVYKYLDKKLLGEEITEVVIKDPNAALDIFKENLKYNMNLNSDFTIKDGKTISGKVQIQDFIIYNVFNDRIEIYTLSKSGIINKVIKNKSEKVIAPNGYTVVATTVYTSINFDIDKLFGEKEKKEIKVGTDIVNYKDY